MNILFLLDRVSKTWIYFIWPRLCISDYLSLTFAFNANQASFFSSFDAAPTEATSHPHLGKFKALLVVLDLLVLLSWFCGQMHRGRKLLSHLRCTDRLWKWVSDPGRAWTQNGAHSCICLSSGHSRLPEPSFQGSCSVSRFAWVCEWWVFPSGASPIL